MSSSSARLERVDHVGSRAVSTERRVGDERVPRRCPNVAAGVILERDSVERRRYIDLHTERPRYRDTEGRVRRVLRFKVPFVHTAGGTFFRPVAIPHKKKVRASRGDRTHDHAVKSRALYQLS